MLFNKKRKKEFVNLLKHVHELLDEGKFDEASALYNKLKTRYDLLPRLEKSEKMKKDIESLSKQLLLYLKINEAGILIKKGKLDMLRQKLGELRVFLNEVSIKFPEAFRLIRYADKYYKFYSDMYKKRCYETNFYAKLRKIRNLIKKDKINMAIKEYHNLLQYYQVILEYKDVSELRPILDSLLDTLEIKKLEKQAREKINPVNLKIQEIKEDIYIPKRRINATKTISFNPLFKDFYALIKKNKYQEASMLLNNV